MLLLSTQQRPCASSTAPHTLQLALPIRRTPLLTGRRNPRCLASSGCSEFFGCPLGSRCPPGHLRLLVTCCPPRPSCSAISLLLGVLQATRLPLKHSASSQRPIQRPAGHSASSWLLCAFLLVRRHPDCSATFLLPDVMAAQCHLGWCLLTAQRTPVHSMHSQPFGATGCMAYF